MYVTDRWQVERALVRAKKEEVQSSRKSRSTKNSNGIAISCVNRVKRSNIDQTLRGNTAWHDPPPPHKPWTHETDELQQYIQVNTSHDISFHNSNKCKLSCQTNNLPNHYWKDLKYKSVSFDYVNDHILPKLCASQNWNYNYCKNELNDCCCVLYY